MSLTTDQRSPTETQPPAGPAETLSAAPEIQHGTLPNAPAEGTETSVPRPETAPPGASPATGRSPDAGSTEEIPRCPPWFFGLAAILLTMRPACGLFEVSSWPVPAFWEPVFLVLLLLGTLLVAPGIRLFAAVSAWGVSLALIHLAIPMSGIYSWLFLLAFVEGLAPETAPMFWCLSWAALPAWHGALFGEPLCTPLLGLFVVYCLIAAYRTTLPRWVLSNQHSAVIDLLIGLGLGGLLFALPPMASPASIPPVVFDESHASSESAEGSDFLLNGHQQLAQWLTRQNIPVSFSHDLTTGIPSGSLIISILPTKPLRPDETTTLLKHVEQGGKLLLITDHTDMDGASSRLSPLLQKLGLGLRFDTLAWPGAGAPVTGISRAMGNIHGFPGTGGTIDPPQFWLPYWLWPWGPHPLVWVNGAVQPTAGIPSSALNQQLATTDKGIGSTYPLWTGAWGMLGKGTWACFSDSSWFQNGQFPQNAEFFQRLVNLLQAPPLSPQPLATLFFLILFFRFFALSYRLLKKPLLPLGIAIGISFGAVLANAPTPAELEKETSTACFILDRRSPVGVTSMQPDTFLRNVDGLLDGIFRAGWRLSFLDPEQQVVKKADLWLLPPTDSPTAGAFLVQVEMQVKNGATLLLSGDYDIPASRKLLAAFGFQLEPTPARYFLCDNNDLGLPQKAQALPTALTPASHTLLASWTGSLWSDEPTPVYGGEPLFVRSDGLPVIAARRLQDGWVIAIGDRHFFSNSAIEIRGKIDDPVKKTFIQYLCQTLKGKGKPANE